MNQIKPADNFSQAELISYNYIRENYKNKIGHTIVSVKHKVDVLINHNGEVPIHFPIGWKFSFYRDSTEKEWQLLQTEEY